MLVRKVLFVGWTEATGEAANCSVKAVVVNTDASVHTTVSLRSLERCRVLDVFGRGERSVTSMEPWEFAIPDLLWPRTSAMELGAITTGGVVAVTPKD